MVYIVYQDLQIKRYKYMNSYLYADVHAAGIYNGEFLHT